MLMSVLEGTPLTLCILEMVEVNTDLTLYSQNDKIDTIDTTSDTDMLFKKMV